MTTSTAEPFVDPAAIVIPGAKLRRVTIQGISPLLVHKWNEAAAESVAKGSRTANRPNSAMKDTPRALAETFLYTDTDGDPCMPNPNLLKCLMQGGQFFKVGRKQITTRDSSIFPGAVTLIGDTFKITPKEWEVDQRRAVNQVNKAAVLATRPRFDLPWSITFDVAIDEDVLKEDEVRDCVDAAGKRIGLGAFRPECKGPFGKFLVKCWDEIEQ